MKKILVFILVLLLCSAVFASYFIEEANVSVNIGKNAVHSIKEDYTFNFLSAHHGFYRYIQTDYSYLESPLHALVSSVKCSDRYEREDEDGYFVMKIGSSSQSYTGLKDYSISYNYDLGADYNKGYDEFYLNLWGTDWEVAVSKFSFSVFVPTSDDGFKVWVTRGQYGANTSVDYSVQPVSGGFLISGECSSLRAGEAVTIRVQLQDGFFVGAREPWDYRGVMQPVSLIVSAIVVVLAAFVWATAGRDPIPIISAKFNPPDGMSPLSVGYLVDGSVDDRDITSMLFYWADRGYIEIQETKKNKFVFVHKTNIPKNSPKSEQTLFYGMFNCSNTDYVTLEQLQDGNYFEKMQKAKLEEVGYFRKDRALTSTKCNVLSALFTVLSVVPHFMLCLGVGLYEFSSDAPFGLFVQGLLFVTVINVLFAQLFRKWYVRKSNLGPGFVICAFSVVYIALGSVIATSISEVSAIYCIFCLLCSVLTAFFARIIPKRSLYGIKLLEDVLGYREFIDKVSMSELILMIDKDPEYYYHVLSYAIALGLEDKWAKKFECVTVVRPSWYSGISPMDVYFYSTLSSRMRTAVKTAAIPPQVKNSGRIGGHGGGFNMGGFAGGGFGGGGERAW